MKIVLASRSPRRKQLLGSFCPDFTVQTCDAEEKTSFRRPCSMVKSLAEQKATAVFASNPDAVVIGADTIVVLDGVVLGKPHSYDEAVDMLSRLSGRVHEVYTGVCIVSASRKFGFYVRSQVEFYSLQRQRIEDYVASGSPMDKAGAYGIQDSGFVKRIYGSYTSVMGLPVEETAKALLLFTEDETNG